MTRQRPRSPHSTIFSGRNLTWLLALRAQQTPQHPFLVWEPFAGARRTWSYAEFARDVRRVAATFTRRGVHAGDRILVHLDNCPEYLLAFFACAQVGAIAVCTNTRLAPDELRYCAEHSEASGYITQPEFADVVAAVLPRAVLTVVTGPGEQSDAISGPDGSSSAPASPVAPLAPLSIQYTSGTTGRPKAVVWTHANALWAAKVNAAHEGLTSRDVQLTFLPLFHTNAQGYSVLATLWTGCTVVLQPRFSASRFWDAAVRNQCTFASHVYFTLRALAEHEVPAEHSFRLWGTGICGHPSESYTGVPTLGWWGMTETISHPIVGDLVVPNRRGTIGRPAPEYQIAVLHEDGTPAGPDETGHLLVDGVRGVSLFAEYLNDPGATEEAFDERGWFRTGDRVTVHRDGSISFADRVKDMLRVGGENVGASEIERVIAGVDGVAEVAVVGAPDPMLDEIPVAFLTTRGAVHDVTDRVLTACRASLADFKVPREIRIVDDLPRSTLEKVAKHTLRQQLRDEARTTT